MTTKLFIDHCAAPDGCIKKKLMCAPRADPVWKIPWHAPPVGVAGSDVDGENTRIRKYVPNEWKQKAGALYGTAGGRGTEGVRNCTYGGVQGCSHSAEMLSEAKREHRWSSALDRLS